ncbi:MAG: FG-GAP repeat protein [Deltaproteobacteria bacterium]|nr:FG-GAP repeat protein [Deltaproteobacteria bacterium]
MGAWFQGLWLAAGCAGGAEENGSDRPAGADGGADTAPDSEVSGTDSVPDTGPEVGDSAVDTGECEVTAWYRDGDGDGAGRDELPTWACQAPPRHVANHLDCDDEHALARPGAFDRPLDGVDGDCDREFGISMIGRMPAWRFGDGEQSDEWWHGHIGVALTAGDVTGDGHSDLVVGSWSQWLGDGDRHSGAVFVFAGPLAAARSVTAGEDAVATLLPGSLDWTDYVCTVPDTDGDGYIELLVAGAYDSDGMHAGVAYLAGFPLTGMVDLPSVARTFHGHHTNANLGPCAASDFDGDGLGDLVLTSMYEHDGQDTLGRAYLMLGPIEHDDIDEAELILEGAFNDEALGASVANAGDVDGDGLPDFVLTTAANTKDDSDMVAYVLTDRPGGVMQAASVAAVLDYSTGSDGRTMQLTAGEVGDVNGDGYADVGLGQDSDGDSFYVLAGPITAGARRVIVDDYVAVFHSWSLGDPELTTATRLGDWNGDGEPADDFALANERFEPSTAPAERNCGSLDETCYAGAVFIVAGPVAPGAYDLERQADRLESSLLDGRLGSALAGGADLDGDGFPDLAIGAPEADYGGGSANGSAYVVFGGPDAVPPAH